MRLGNVPEVRDNIKVGCVGKVAGATHERNPGVGVNSFASVLVK